MSKPKSGLFNGTKGTKTTSPNSNSSTNSSNKNKHHHIFDKERHRLRWYLESFNDDEEAAFNKLNEEYNNYIRNNKTKDGYLEINVNINGFRITIRGVVIDGIGHIGTAYEGDN